MSRRRYLIGLVAAWLAMTGETAIAQDKQTTIANGETSFYKSVVEIRYTTRLGRDKYCSGVLVGKGALLTAAHCACGQPGSYTVWKFTGDKELGTSFDRARAAGNWVSSKLQDPTPFSVRACGPGDIEGYDVAYAKFDAEDIRFPRLTNDDSWIASPFYLRDRGVSHLTVVGYGEDERGSRPNGALEANVGGVTLFCTKGRVALSRCVEFREFVLADRLTSSARDTCEGDSGGPVLYREPNGKTFIVGVTSRGIQGVRNLPGVGCGGGGIYTTLAHQAVVSWLQRNGVAVEVQY